MSTYTEQWATAKAAFKTATNAKKPSAQFLGVFDKGSGIKSALEAVDKAKNVGDYQKGLKDFKTSYDAYLVTLDKAIADPKSTPVADKTTYAAAVTKLKSDLKGIYDSAAKTAASVFDKPGGAQKTDKVDLVAVKICQKIIDPCTLIGKATYVKVHDDQPPSSRKTLHQTNFELLQADARSVAANLRAYPKPTPGSQDTIANKFSNMDKHVKTYTAKTVGTQDILKAFNDAHTAWGELVTKVNAAAK
jgi:hypothetical protein